MVLLFLFEINSIEIDINTNGHFKQNLHNKWQHGRYVKSNTHEYFTEFVRLSSLLNENNRIQDYLESRQIGMIYKARKIVSIFQELWAKKVKICASKNLEGVKVLFEVAVGVDINFDTVDFEEEKKYHGCTANKYLKIEIFESDVKRLQESDSDDSDDSDGSDDGGDRRTTKRKMDGRSFKAQGKMEKYFMRKSLRLGCGSKKSKRRR